MDAFEMLARLRATARAARDVTDPRFRLALARGLKRARRAAWQAAIRAGKVRFIEAGGAR